MTEAYRDLGKVHDPQPIDGKPGFVRGFLKLPPLLEIKNGRTVLKSEYIFGDWNTYLFEACQSNT